jgi:hypothetical protein
MVGDRVELAFRETPIDDEQRVGDTVHGRLETRHHARKPRDEFIPATAKHTAMVVDGIVVIKRTHQLEVSPVAGPTIGKNEILKRLLGDQLIDCSIAGYSHGNENAALSWDCHVVSQNVPETPF